MSFNRFRKPYLASRRRESDAAEGIELNFEYRTMIECMMSAARSNDRTFIDDILYLITVYYSEGTNNIEKILSKWEGRNKMNKERLEKLRSVYCIQQDGKYFGAVPTLSRISESFPHISLVIWDSINSGPRSPFSLLEDEELGAEVNHHLKSNYFPGLFEEDEAGIKASAAFVLFNLCQTKAILKTSAQSALVEENVIRAFTFSCKTSLKIMESRLAPVASRIKFTHFLKTLPITPFLLFKVWRNVIGNAEIVLSKDTAVTFFHEKVYKFQPLTLEKWNDLMMGCEKEE